LTFNQQKVRLKELRRPRSGKHQHPRELSALKSAVSEVRAEQLVGRILVLHRADFDSKVWAPQSADVFFFAT